MTDYFEELPPELIGLLPPSLSSGSLNSLILTCRRLREILQPQLEALITPKFGRQLLLEAAAAKPHIVAKLLSPPHLINPNYYGFNGQTPLHIAVTARKREIAILLLKAGANINASAAWDQDECQALHLAALHEDLEMMKLLLDHDASIDAEFGIDGCHETALHYACSESAGHLEMVQLLLDRGPNLENRGHFGSALGFAVHSRKLDVVKLLLDKGANAAVTVPLFVLLGSGRLRKPHRATLLYIAMQLRQPSDKYEVARRKKTGEELAKWEGLPLSEPQKQLMALLLAYGAGKDATIKKISRHLTALAKEAKHTEEEYMSVIIAMLKEAEDAIPDAILSMYK
ncbi:ankyrin repeat-containing domain protein [Mycena capillaripes]|nr:ankyrin repeat-containing domain protein [Mycena capillaripes]